MPTALIFPGQGAHAPEMLHACPEQVFASPLWQQLCELVDNDPRQMHDPAYFARNEVASLLTVFLSLRALQSNKPLWEKCYHYAGYSVGQVSALYAAGLLLQEDVLPLVFERALAMNECLKNSPNTGMLACIGLTANQLTGAIQDLQLTQTSISNYNAPGQLTVAGAVDELSALEERLRALKPRKLLRIATEGAWHSPWLKSAQTRVEQIFLRALTKTADIRPNGPIKIACNVTGQWLDHQPPKNLAHLLGRQVAEAVQWESCVRTCIADGVSEFVEMGYGSVLTRFGFFIDRSLIHRHWET